MKTNFDKYYNEARMVHKIPKGVDLWSSAKGKTIKKDKDIYDEPTLVEKAKTASSPDEARKLIEDDVYGQFKDTDEAEKAISRILDKAGV